MSDRILAVKDVFIENSQKYLAYLIKENGKDCLSFPEGYILNTRLRSIFKSIKKIVEEEGKVEIDLIFDNWKTIDSTAEYKDLKLIIDSYSNFVNIDIIKKRLKENYLKQHNIKKIVEDLFVNLDINDDLDLAKLEKFHMELGEDLRSIKDENKLKPFSNLIEDYKQVLINRKQGINKKSIGNDLLDKLITRPGEPGACTSLIMMKGYGKTLVSNNLKNYLINTGVCVLEFQFDMQDESINDRIISLRENISVSDLNSAEILKSRKFSRKVKRALDSLSEIPNYLRFSEGTISINEIDSFIYEAKSIFSKRGVLPEDDYIFLIFDTLDMVEEFSKAKSGYDVKDAVNRKHSIIKKHKVHSFDLLQANENKIRSMSFSTPADLDFFRIGKEDAEGGASYTSRSRLVLTGHRPLQMKKEFFPDHEDRELWDFDEDLLLINCVKQNDGSLFFRKFILDQETFRLIPEKPKPEVEEEGNGNENDNEV